MDNYKAVGEYIVIEDIPTTKEVSGMVMGNGGGTPAYNY